jgi:hypothetical protein
MSDKNFCLDTLGRRRPDLNKGNDYEIRNQKIFSWGQTATGSVVAAALTRTGLRGTPARTSVLTTAPYLYVEQGDGAILAVFYITDPDHKKLTTSVTVDGSHACTAASAITRSGNRSSVKGGRDLPWQ